MRAIKFRGRDVQTGECVYGDLVQKAGCRVIMDGASPYLVETDSVAQLVGTDKNGREIYEGDVLQYDYNGVHYEYKARLDSCAVADNGCYLLAKQLSAHELKEVST